MASGTGYYIILTTVCILLPGCSAIPTTGVVPQPASRLTQESPDPETDPLLDHFVARVPYRLADTATEARAMTHVAIGRAKARTGNRLCGRAWLMTGPASGSAGPRLANATGEPAWYYRISHQSGLAGCGTTSREDLYEALEATLPVWITLRRGASEKQDDGGITLYDASRSSGPGR